MAGCDDCREYKCHGAPGCHCDCHAPRIEVEATARLWEVEIGEDRCFHQGNRVAITVSGFEDGEPYNVTIAELWPADHDRDIIDAQFIVQAVKSHQALVDALQGLFEHCAMVHKHWGEGSNQKEADAAIKAAHAALKLAGG